MKIRFNYKNDITFYLKTSCISIEGKGIWSVNEWELSEEYNISDLCFEDFIENYFENTLHINPGCIKFIPLDYDNLKEFCNERKDIYGN